MGRDGDIFKQQLQDQKGWLTGNFHSPMMSLPSEELAGRCVPGNSPSPTLGSSGGGVKGKWVDYPPQHAQEAGVAGGVAAMYCSGNGTEAEKKWSRCG